MKAREKRPFHQVVFRLRMILAVLIFTLGWAAVACAAPQEVKIGVLAKRGSEISLAHWAPTAAYLSQVLPEYSFLVIPLSFDEILPAVEDKEIDFILANSAIYAGLEAMYGASSVATMQNLLSDQDSTLFGGVILYRAERTDIRSLHDLTGKRFMAVDKTSLGGWLAVWRELKDNGINPDRDFASLEFAGTHDAVVHAVLKGTVDAGTVRTDTLERMAAEKKIRLEDFGVLPFTYSPGQNQVDFIHKSTYQEFPYRLSTHLYPEWPFAKLDHTSEVLSKKVAIALFNMPADSQAARAAKISGWTIPLQYQPVRECLKDLRVWPYQDFGKFSFTDVVRKYRYGLLFALAGIIGLSTLSLIVVQLNKKLAHGKKALEQYKDELEKRVVERTADLIQANENLRQKILEKQQAEDKLKKWANIFEHAEWGVVVCPVDGGQIEMMNPAFARMHGYLSDELPGQSCVNFVAEEERQRLEQHIALADQCGHHTFESTHVRKDGTRFPVFLDITVVNSKDGTPRYHVVNVQDISERKRIEREKEELETELRQSQKMEAIGTLAGGIAHDFNNILSAIIGYAELAKRNIPKDNTGQGNIDQIIKASYRAADLVRQILTFSRKTPHLQQIFSPHTIIKETLKMLRSSLPTTITIREMIDPKCGLIEADPTKIHQIMLNLCTNAFHAMEQTGGTLQVSLQRKEIGADEIRDERIAPGPFIVLSVTDTGHGMNQATLARIFDPYFTTKEVGKGTGLGLAVIHGIVQDYHGFIKAESDPGKGSSFHVHLPALAHDAAISPNMQPSDSCPGGTEKILVVDDEEAIAELTRTMLEQLGYEVTAMLDSQQALAAVTGDPHRFDLVITDQTMPNLTGAELARKILEIRPQMPIILCTGYSSIISEEESLAMGIRKFITKPVDRTNLARLVRNVLDEKEISQGNRG